MADQNDALAMNNRRRIMRSNIFDDSVPTARRQPVVHVPPAVPLGRHPPPNPVSGLAPPAYGNLPDFRSQFQGFDDVAAAPSLPSLSPFPHFRFDIAAPPAVSDLGVRPRATARPIAATRIELKTGNELERLRADIERQAAALPERLKGAARDGPLPALSFALPAIAESNLPEIATTAQFLFPDAPP
jgi:hypothetical protein